MNIKQQLVSSSLARAVSFGTGNPKKFITVHQTGNPSRGANAQAHANLQSRGFSASWHWQVDDKEAIQSFGHTWRLWHAGDGRGKGNMESIGIESCINSDGDYVKAVRNTAKLVAKIMKDENIPIDRVVQHNYWSGKNCPMQIRAGQAGINWNKFIQMVKENLGKPSDKPASKPTQSSPTYYDYPPATYEVLRAINTYDKPSGNVKGKLAKGAKIKAIKEVRSGVPGVWLQLDDGRYVQAQEWRTINVKKIAAKPTTKQGIDGRTSGTWQVTARIGVNVRTEPSADGDIVAAYQKGQEVNIHSTVTAGGYIWGQYIGATSGQKRYVALGTTSGTRYGKWV